MHEALVRLATFTKIINLVKVNLRDTKNIGKALRQDDLSWPIEFSNRNNSNPKER